MVKTPITSDEIADRCISWSGFMVSYRMMIFLRQEAAQTLMPKQFVRVAQRIPVTLVSLLYGKQEAEKATIIPKPQESSTCGTINTPPFNSILSSSMNQIKRWVEHKEGFRSSRPTLNLQTVNSYDCDESFSIVALNLLSRYEYFGMKPEDAILETLVTPRERLGFLEALNVRKMYTYQTQHHLSPSTLNLVQTLDSNFGEDLTRMVERESPTMASSASAENTGRLANVANNTAHMAGDTMFRQHPCVKTQRKNVEERHSKARGSRSTRGNLGKRAFFFPDTTGFFGVTTSSKVTARNIDWKLTEAIEQVSSLRLDGMAMSPTATASTVSGTSTSSTALSYVPPTVSGTMAQELHQQHSDTEMAYTNF